MEQAKRPRLHFTPPQGWMNDPNGLLYHDGEYHLYYQYDPENMTPVNLHWGHATSKNLVDWQHHPVALYPDEHGLIYSGSLVWDRDNTAGLGGDGEGPLVACYTYHKDENGSYTQSQALAASTDGGRTYSKYSGNPVLRYHEKDFRDPMVFWHEETGRWVMVLVAGRSVRLYHSANLREWALASVFTAEYAPAEPGEIWECPCLVQLADEAGTLHWVLFVSVFTPKGTCFGMQYFVGHFDGEGFAAYRQGTAPRMLDAGLDFYAGAVFGGNTRQVLMMAWMNCWCYARTLPAANYRGTMAFPRELSLVAGPDGPIVRQRFAGVLCEKLAKEHRFENATKLPLKAECQLLQLSLKWEPARLLFTDGKESVALEIDPENTRIHVTRSSDVETSMPDRDHRHFTIQCNLAEAERLELAMLWDVNSVEILCGQGAAACTMLHFMQPGKIWLSSTGAGFDAAVRVQN